MKKIAAPFFALLCLLLLLFSAPACEAAREGLRLWAQQVVPVLFPFFVCADMARRFSPATSGPFPLFIMSAVSGAPSGAKLVSYCKPDAKSAARLCAALNMTGPMFITGAFCLPLMGSALCALPILMGQYMSAALMLLSCRAAFPLVPQHAQSASKPPLLQSLADSIFDGVQAMLSIGGSIVAFRVLLTLLDALAGWLGLPAPAPLPAALLSGLLEFVSGSMALSACALPYPLLAAAAAFLFSFGGLCVLAQSLRFLPLHAPLYLARKLLQALLAAAFAYIFALLLPANTAAVFNPPDAQLVMENSLSALGMFFASSLSFASLWLLLALRGGKKKNRPGKGRLGEGRF